MSHRSYPPLLFYSRYNYSTNWLRAAVISLVILLRSDLNSSTVIAFSFSKGLIA